MVRLGNFFVLSEAVLEVPFVPESTVSMSNCSKKPWLCSFFEGGCCVQGEMPSHQTFIKQVALCTGAKHKKHNAEVAPTIDTSDQSVLVSEPISCWFR